MLPPIHLTEDILNYCKTNNINFSDLAKAININAVSFNAINNNTKMIIFIRVCSYLHLSFDATLNLGNNVAANLKQAVMNNPGTVENTLKQMGLYDYFEQHNQGRFVFGNFTRQSKKLNNIKKTLKVNLDDMIINDYY